MRYPNAYLKMRVLGAVENAEGKTLEQRVKNTANMVFTDEDGNPRTFSWRTIFIWYYRYKNHGVTGVDIKKPRRQRQNKNDISRATARGHQPGAVPAGRQDLKQVRDLPTVH